MCFTPFPSRPPRPYRPNGCSAFWSVGQSGTESSVRTLVWLTSKKPRLVLVPGSLKLSRAAAGQGELVARLRAEGEDGKPQPLCSVRGTLRRPDTKKAPGAELPALPASSLRIHQTDGGTEVELHLRDLIDGKYTVSLEPSARGKLGEPLLFRLQLAL